MRFKNWSLPYFFSYILFYFARKGYFRKVSKRNSKLIPKGHPVIFAINHQNSLVDPCIVATSTVKSVFFLVRSDVFKIPFVSKILHSINMMPIYRKKDGPDFIEKNVSVFKKCATILSKNGGIMIFPEGSTNTKNRLRVLKKGIVRIAKDAHKISDKDVYIVSIGLNYSNVENKCSDLFVNYGTPINVSSKLKSLGEIENENELFSPIMSELRFKMENLILHYEKDDFYELYDFLIRLVDKSQNRFSKNLGETFDLKQKKTQLITDYISTNKAQALKYLEDCILITKECENLNIKPYLFQKKSYSIIFDFVLLVLSFPIFIYGFINNYLPFIIPQKTLNVKIKDSQFHQAVNMIVGAFAFFIFWSIQTLIISLLFDYYIGLVYFISLPISGWLSFEYYIKYRRFIGKQKYNSLWQTNSKLMNSLKNKYEKLNNFITEL